MQLLWLWCARFSRAYCRVKFYLTSGLSIGFWPNNSPDLAFDSISYASELLSSRQYWYSKFLWINAFVKESNLNSPSANFGKSFCVNDGITSLLATYTQNWSPLNLPDAWLFSRVINPYFFDSRFSQFLSQTCHNKSIFVFAILHRHPQIL